MHHCGPQPEDFVEAVASHTPSLCGSFDTDKGRMLKMPPPKVFGKRGLSFRFSQTEGDDDEVKQLLKPPVVNLTIRKLKDNRRFVPPYELHGTVRATV